ncbi:MAG TPA: MerR family transcriptional regulator [candidate division Zixibacteria bacterium]|nr:MerR family transcriptional regulator [candidate division Zixibacteria bacterium]
MEHKHPIKVVEKRTGLSSHVMRIWERRYSAVTPERTDSNRRMYTDGEIERLILLRKATQAGESNGQIARLSDPQLKMLVESSASNFNIDPRYSSGGGNGESYHEPRLYLKECLDAIVDLDSEKLEKILLRASSELTQPEMMEKVLEPLMYKIGDLWREGTLRVVHEHLASAVVRSFLGNMVGALKVDESAPKIIVTTPPGQIHEFGALMVTIAASSAGWHSIYLGPELPAEEIANAVKNIEARAVALSIVYPPDDPRLGPELRRLRQILDDEVVLLVGGRSSGAYNNVLEDLGIEAMQRLSDLHKHLEKIRSKSNGVKTDVDFN